MNVNKLLVFSLIVLDLRLVFTCFDDFFNEIFLCERVSEVIIEGADVEVERSGLLEDAVLDECIIVLVIKLIVPFRISSLGGMISKLLLVWLFLASVSVSPVPAVASFTSV